MQPDELIKQAMGGGGKMVGGPELYILEGNPERNEFSVKTADSVFKDNVIAFAYKVPTGFLFLGMYTTKEAAEEGMETVRTLFRDEDGKTLL